MRPFRPMRSCLKRMEPCEVSLMARAAMRMAGIDSISSTADAVTPPPVRQTMAVRDESEDLVAPVFVLGDLARHFQGAASGADDEEGAVVEALGADVAREHPQQDLFQQEERGGEDAEEDEPG